jgi:hypothetical protein
MYGNGYLEFMYYSAIDALPNPGNGGATGVPTGGPGNQDTNVDLCDNPPRKIPYYRLRPIHFGH